MLCVYRPGPRVLLHHVTEPHGAPPTFPSHSTVFKSLHAVACWPWCRHMDPGGSDLESSLPQTENPCLIVEDSQPDSVALEDDPDSSYRALLSRRLSNLQPTSHSPVLVRSPTSLMTAFLALTCSFKRFCYFCCCCCPGTDRFPFKRQMHWKWQPDWKE